MWNARSRERPSECDRQGDHKRQKVPQDDAPQTEPGVIEEGPVFRIAGTEQISQAVDNFARAGQDCRANKSLFYNSSGEEPPEKYQQYDGKNSQNNRRAAGNLAPDAQRP